MRRPQQQQQQHKQQQQQRIESSGMRTGWTMPNGHVRKLCMCDVFNKNKAREKKNPKQKP